MSTIEIPDMKSVILCKSCKAENSYQGLRCKACKTLLPTAKEVKAANGKLGTLSRGDALHAGLIAQAIQYDETTAWERRK